ncbi:MAG TPA: serine/threonine-protein kinase [Vicinamibacterales bacterium]|nr:serine/threonine-protein kinase [Vicinamibacterales bacterium]
MSDLVDLAAIVADGDTPDWDEAASHVTGERARSIVVHLRAIAEVGRLHATLNSRVGRSGATHARLEPGATWGPLQILEHVGAGRFGDVYRAFDPGLDREVALKLLRDRDGGSSVDAFVVHEGRLAARVRHPNVVTVYGAQRIGDRTGVWMEFVVGRTLEAELAAGGPFDAGTLAQVATDLCGALAAVHEAGLVHRDVKASNVMRDARGRVVLGDFGTGRELIEGDDLRVGVAGTPAYIAPEIFRGAPATVQSDLYSFGVLLFHLATNDFPIRGRSLSEVRSAHSSGQARKVRDLRPDLDSRLADVIDGALAPEPESRFPSLAAMTHALQECTPAAATRRRRRMFSALAAGLAVVAVAALWLMPRAQPVPSLGNAPWVLIGQIENQTGDPAMGGQVTDAFERSSRELMSANIVSRDRILGALQLMTKSPDAPLDSFTAREVALRDGGVGAIIRGRIEQIGDSPTLTLQIARPGDSSVAATVQEPIRSSAMLEAAVRRATMRVRQSLGESRGSLAVNPLFLEKVTTPSLEALTLYTQAIRLLTPEREARRPSSAWRTAEALLLEAVTKDPNLAAAQMALATWACTSPSCQSGAKQRAELAMALAKHRTETERFGVMGSYHKLHGFWASKDPTATQAHYVQAAEAFEEVLRREPRHVFTLWELSDTYLRLERHVEAARLHMQLAEMNPNTFGWQIRAAQALATVGDFAVAEKAALAAPAALTAADYQADPFGSAWILLVPAHRAWLDNQALEARRAIDRVAALLDTLPNAAQYQFRSQLADAYHGLGRLDDAERMARGLPASVPNVQDQTNLLLAPVLSTRGDVQALREVVEETGPAQRWKLVHYAVQTGLFSDARAAIARFRSTAGGLDYTAADAVEGMLAVEQGRFAEAVHILRRPVTRPLTGAGLYRKLRTLAAALFGIGDSSGVIAALEAGSNTPRHQAVVAGGSMGQDWIKMRADLADAYRRVGRTAQAEAVEAELRTLLAEADDDHPLKMKLARMTKQ